MISAAAIGQLTAQVGIVPDNPALRLAVPRGGDLIDDLGILGQRAIAMQEAGRDPKLAPVLRAQFGAGLLAVALASLAGYRRRYPRSRRARPGSACPARSGRSGNAARAARRAHWTRRDCPARTGRRMPASANRSWFQVSEKNPRGSWKRRGVSRSTSGIARRSTFNRALLPPVPSTPARDQSFPGLARARAACRPR